MRILIAPDKFKDALTAMEAALAIEAGIKSALPDVQCSLLPLADGGEGTAELLTKLSGGITHRQTAHNPLFQAVECHWGYVEQEQKAFVELAEASGLKLLPELLRNPMDTSTFGTGELIRVALESGARELVIGLGGSATNDGGCGMAAALGYRFLDHQGKEITRPTGKDLIRIRTVNTAGVLPELQQPALKIKAACDVNNPLLGPTGATYTYARQKGATEEMLPVLEEGMQQLAEVLQKDLGIAVANTEGSGAAGGAGAGVLAFLKGNLCSGADLILEYSGFHQKIKEADLLITGEGKIDATSLQGKLVGRLCALAKDHSVPVVAFCGSTELPGHALKESFLKEVIPVSTHEKSLKEALKNTRQNLINAAQKYFAAHFGN